MPKRAWLLRVSMHYQGRIMASKGRRIRNRKAAFMVVSSGGKKSELSLGHAM